MATTLCFGIDSNESLLLTSQGGRRNDYKTLLSFFEQFKDNKFIITFLSNNHEDFKRQAGGNYLKIYNKNDNDYNFEDSVHKFMENVKGNEKYPVFIMKNGIWYQASPATGMMLIPCEEK